MKLYSRAGSFRGQKVLIAAEYAGKSVSVVEAKEKTLKGKAVARLPLLETSEGDLFESNSIMRYIAGGKTELCGKDAFEKAKIDSWMDFCLNEVEVPAQLSTYAIIGWTENYPDVTAQAVKDLKAALTVLEGHLKLETYMVGRQITLADIALAAALVLPFKLILDDKTRKPFSSVTRWFTTCVNQPQFLEVLGPVTLVKKAVVCKAPAKSSGGAAKKSGGDAPKSAPAEPAKKKEEKPGDALARLPKSSFVLDSWKRQYSNAPNGDCYAAMPWFWENVDLKGYTIFKSTYNYNDECKIPFQVSNLCTGFCQRNDAVRKYLFGTLQIIGEEGKMEIVGCWIMRGDSAQPIIDANPDAEYHTWTPYKEPITDEQKKEIADLWCAEETVYGKPILDCKVFK